MPDAERVRRQLVGEVSQKVTLIQNASLGEHRIREINDEINRLIRQKNHWERQILKLGGRDYAAGARRQQTKTLGDEGKEIPGAKGYLYFGAARDLPGVRELFAPTDRQLPKRKRADVYKNLDLEYYGIRDEWEEKKLREDELNIENRSRKKKLKAWNEENRKRRAENGERTLKTDNRFPNSDHESESSDPDADLFAESTSPEANENEKEEDSAGVEGDLELEKKRKELLMKFLSVKAE